MHTARIPCYGVAGWLLVGLLAVVGCSEGSALFVSLESWPEGAVRVRLRTMLNGEIDTDRFLMPGELRFVVRMPSGASGSVRLDAVGLDSRACEVALGTLEDRVPTGLRRWAERTLSLTTQLPPICPPLPNDMSSPGPAPLAVHNESVGSFTVDGQYVYWTSQGQIWRLAKVGSPTATPIVTIGHNPQSLAVDSASFYWPDYSQQRVMKAPLGGGSPMVLSANLGSSPQWVHLDATNVYWPTDGVTSAIQTVSKSGGTAMSMITTGQPDAIEVDASNVYWISVSSGTGAINRLNKATLSNQVIATMGSAWKALAIDDTHVYAASENTVVRVPKTGGTVETIATNQANVQDLALGVTSVYWTNFVADGTVMRALKTGGGLGPVAINQPMAGWILVDGNTVYWSVSGKLVKVDVASP